VGKTHFSSTTAGVNDSDSSNFGWAKTAPGEAKRRDPEWPNNYIAHIKRLLGRAEVTYIMVSSHQEVRDALVAEGIHFALVYPSADIKAEYIQRYKDWGNSPGFVKLLDINYEDWVAGLEAQPGCEHRPLKTGQYLSDVLT